MRNEKEPCVYILASGMNGTLYIGVTSDIFTRMREHEAGTIEGFTKQYCVHSLVYVEFHTDMEVAIKREKQLKKWKRNWKIRLIEQMNPQWHNLFSVENGVCVSAFGGQQINRAS